MTPSELELVRKRYPVGPGVAKLNAEPCCQVSGAVAQPSVRDALPSARERTKKDRPRYVVRIESHRARFCDPDNLCGKFFVDALRYAGILPDDTAAIMDYSIGQQKAKKGEERTEIKVTRVPEFTPQEAAEMYSKFFQQVQRENAEAQKPKTV